MALGDWKGRAAMLGLAWLALGATRLAAPVGWRDRASEAVSEWCLRTSLAAFGGGYWIDRTRSFF